MNPSRDDTAVVASRALRLRKSKSLKLPALTLLPIVLSIGERGIEPRVPMPKFPSWDALSNDIGMVWVKMSWAFPTWPLYSCSKSLETAVSTVSGEEKTPDTLGCWVLSTESGLSRQPVTTAAVIASAPHHSLTIVL